MRVLHVYRTYYPDPPGGLQEAIRQICLSTRDRGISSTVFALSPQPDPVELIRPESRVLRARSWWAPASCDLGLAAAFRRFSEAADDADIIQFHFPWPFEDLLNLLPAARRKPRIMMYHSDIIRQRLLGTVYRPLMRHTLSTMDAVVATSPDYAATSPVLQSLVADGQRKVIPLGIDDRAEPGSGTVDPAHPVLAKLGLKPDQFVLTVGVLRYYKGLHTLVDAARQIDLPVVIAGSGPEEAALRQQAARLGLENIRFAGQVTDEERDVLLRACRLFAFPSHLRSEAFGMALVEASMFGKPMVACDIGSGMSYVNRDDETGLMVSPESPSQLAMAINRLIADESLARRLGGGARRRYEKLFSGQALGGAWSELYHTVFDQRGQP